MRVHSFQNGWHLFAGAVLLSGSTAPLLGSSCGDFTVDVVALPFCGLSGYGIGVGGLNENGDVTGWYTTCAKQAGGFYWTKGALSLIDFGPNTYGGGSDINSKLQIVGTKEGPTGHVGFLYDNGVTIDIGMLPGSNFAEAYAINESSQIVGYANNVLTGPLRAFLWDNGELEALKLPVGTDSAANDINDSGYIVGWMGFGLLGEAFIWHNGETTPLGFPPAGIYSEAKAISNNGKVCGGCVIPNPGGKGFVLRACYWADGVAIELGVLPGLQRSLGRDVSDDGKVVGECFEGGPSRAFLWHNGVMINLNNVVPPAMNLTLTQGKSINDNGQILCAARDGNNASVAVLLTPIPSPIGDSDCDGDIDVDDLLKVINTWGAESPKNSNALPPADFNHDGIVSLPDLVIVIDNWTL